MASPVEEPLVSRAIEQSGDPIGLLDLMAKLDDIQCLPAEGIR
jgi:hypothetical protein